MNKKRFEVTQMVQLSMLIAILVILAATQLGFINYGVVSITILHIPVIIGSILMGPVYGGFLGFFFGIISMANATLRGATPIDMMFSPFVSGHPFPSVIMCIVPRVILGILPACFYTILSKRIRKKGLGIAISSAFSTMVHTILVLGCLYFLFFPDMKFIEVLQSIFQTVVGVNGVLESAAAAVLCSAVCVPLLSYLRSTKQNDLAPKEKWANQRTGYVNNK